MFKVCVLIQVTLFLLAFFNYIGSSDVNSTGVLTLGCMFLLSAKLDHILSKLEDLEKNKSP